MALKARKAIIVAEIESTKGTDATPDGADAYLISNVVLTPLAGPTVSRDNLRSYIGANQHIHVGTHVQLTFDAEVVGGGAVDTAPKWGKLVRACGWDETINASTSVVYDPLSDNEETVTIYIYMDGQLHPITYVHGSFSMNFAALAYPKFSFAFTGIYNAPSTSAAPTPTYPTQDPLPVSNTNTPTVQYDSYDAILQSATLNMNVNVVHTDRPNEEKVQIVDRTPGGSMSLQAPVLSTKNFFTIAKANTEAALAITHGTAAGNIVSISAPKTQLLSPSYGDENGELMLTTDLSINPNAGNDEFVITTT